MNSLTSRTICVTPKGDEQPRLLSIQEYEAFSKTKYLPKLQTESKYLETNLRKSFQRAESKQLIENDRLWLGAYYSEYFNTGFVNQIEIKWVNNLIGYGVYATKDLRKKEYLGEYTGVLLKFPFMKYAPNKYSFAYPLPTITSRLFPTKYSINAHTLGNEMRFINHSDDPNCEAIGVMHDGILHIAIRTIRNVVAGEQLCYDYGPGYWKRRPKFEN